MITLPRDEGFKLSDKWFSEVSKEWFKVEVMQDYSLEDDSPSLTAWLNGDKQRSVDQMYDLEDLDDWIEENQTKIAAGVKFTRVHLVEYPLNDYLEWEIEHYKRINTILCGERVLIVDKKKTGNLDILDGDFRILDSKRVIANIYKDGLVSRQIFYDGKDDISIFLNLRKELLNLASPLV